MSEEYYEKVVMINAHTAGNGYWSDAKELITVNRLTLDIIIDDEYPDSDGYYWGELRAYFVTDNWNVEEKGLIYTDKLWLEEFADSLFKHYQFNLGAIANIDYSEQGMQGKDFVSMDVGQDFIDDWRRIQRGKPQ